MLGFGYTPIRPKAGATHGIPNRLVGHIRKVLTPDLVQTDRYSNTNNRCIEKSNSVGALVRHLCADLADGGASKNDIPDWCRRHGRSGVSSRHTYRGRRRLVFRTCRIRRCCPWVDSGAIVGALAALAFRNNLDK